jgi:pSer/pThr/pTyr-binding forkhead associated (FHA) protein
MFGLSKTKAVLLFSDGRLNLKFNHYIIGRSSSDKPISKRSFYKIKKDKILFDDNFIFASVSRTHGEFRWDGSTYTYKDLGSKSGSTVNGEKVGNRPLKLKNKDTLIIGNVRIEFLI